MRSETSPARIPNPPDAPRARSGAHARRKRQPKDAQINFRVPGSLNTDTKAAAAIAGCSASEFMRRAILRSLTETLDDQKAEPTHAEGDF